MIQTARIISIYAADTSGVCSALYELGGMTVIHDASGCNSTYTTHDEPRWYDSESMIYISGLTEMDAVMGDDDKLIRDISDAADKLKPKFISICGAPVPMMVGTDFAAIASAVEEKTGIPAFGLHTNGMHSYLCGASEAFKTIVKNFCREDAVKSKDFSVNIIGATPLDFSVNGSVKSIKKWLASNGARVISSMAMGSTLDEISRAGSAHVNLVVSYSGMAAAKALREKFGTPYVAGVPFGAKFSDVLYKELERAAASGKSSAPCAGRHCDNVDSLLVVGESISSGSLACALEAEYNKPVRVLCPLETEDELTAYGDMVAQDEDAAKEQFGRSSGVIADPLYKPVCPAGVPFYSLPHEAFSGRCFRKAIPNLINKNLELRETI